MSQVEKIKAASSEQVEEFDVIIVGAGLAGIGAAWSLAQRAPEKTYVILERREELGGTWSFFKYPGFRSDSDMQTYGYPFRPWTGKDIIAPGNEILDYLRETAEEKGCDKHIRYQHHVKGASWSSEEKLWTVACLVGEEKKPVQVKGKVVFSGAGYYNYDTPYSPEFPGKEDFKGTLIHPQFWPEDFDYTGKKIVVIGSGATAVTLLPNLAEKAAKVTMLQRSPSYIFPLPKKDLIANLANKLLPIEKASAFNLAKNTGFIVMQYQLAQKIPQVARAFIKAVNKAVLPRGYDMKHFTPNYNPWDQRVCVVPNADLFRAIRKGKADVVTDHIERFDANGIILKSGEYLPADVIVTATGLTLGIDNIGEAVVDGKKVEINKEMAYLGAMLTNVPNFILAIGYTNASWTLKMSLLYDLLIKMLNTLDVQGKDYIVVRKDPTIKEKPLMEMESGYLKRSHDEMPRAGDKAPWISRMNFYQDRKDFNACNFEGKEVEIH